MNRLRPGCVSLFLKLNLALALLCAAARAHAVVPTPGTNYLWLDYWDFADTTNWTTFLGHTIRIQTIDTLADGVTPTAYEDAAARRIRTAFPNDQLILIPKR